MKIEAAQRVLAKVRINKPTKAQLEDEDEELVRALQVLYDWYSTNTSSKIKPNTLLKAIGYLVKLFGYVPYDKPVYRVFPLTKEKAATVKVGRTYNLMTAKRPVQSFTTSVSNATAFLNNQVHEKHYCIAKLVSPGKELLNYEWIRTIVMYLIPLGKTYGFYQDVNLLLRKLNDYKDEDEVIMLLPELSKVQIMKIFDY